MILAIILAALALACIVATARTDDVVLQAAAEVTALTHVSPFVPDEVRVTRLAALDAELADRDGDDVARLRVRLLGRRTQLTAAFPDTDVLVFGHSHIPWETTATGGLRLLNPGSPTDRRRQPRHTMGLAHVDGSKLTFELIALD